MLRSWKDTALTPESEFKLVISLPLLVLKAMKAMQKAMKAMKAMRVQILTRMTLTHQFPATMRTGLCYTRPSLRRGHLDHLELLKG